MSNYVDFMSLMISAKLPEEQVLELLEAIAPQLVNCRANLARFETELADALKIEGVLINRLAEHSALDTVDTLRPLYDQVGQKLVVLRKMTADLSTLHAKLMASDSALKQARNAFAVGRANAQEAQEKAAQQQAAESEKRQLEYERRRSLEAYAGNADAIDNWPENVADFDKMMEARAQAAKDAQKAAQDAQNAAREAEEKNRVERVTAWLERLTQI